MKCNLGEVAYQTFRWTGIVFLTTVSVIAMLGGCGDPPSRPTPPPPSMPTIKVEQQETNQNTTLVVIYLNHERDSYGNGRYSEPYVKINKLDNLRAYKKEVEFLLSRIDDTEKKMLIHEDGLSNGQETTTP